MFYLGFKEEKSEIIPIPNIEQETFLLLMEYLYTGRVIITQENIMSLLPVVDQFDVTELRSKCYEFLVKRLDYNNVCTMLIEAQQGKYKFNCDELISCCLKFIEKFATDVVQSDTFLEMQERVLLEMIQSDNLVIDELELFKGIIRWGLHKKKKTKKTLYETVSKLIPHIRLPLIDGKSLLRIVRPTNVVPFDLYLEALEFASAPDHVTPVGKKYKERLSLGFNLEVLPKYKHDFLITNNGKTIEKVTGSEWENGKVFGDKKLTSGRHYWEIKIDIIDNDGSGTVFGITKDKLKSSYASDIAVGMAGSCYHTNGNGIVGKQGDVIGIFVDFNTLLVYFFRNGKNTNIVGKINNGMTYYPVIHIYYETNKFTVTYKNQIPKL